MAKKAATDKTKTSKKTESIKKPKKAASNDTPRSGNKALLLVVGALIGLGGLLIGGGAGYALGRLQDDDTSQAQVLVDRLQGRPYLGVDVMLADGGMLIHTIQPDSPAEDAGLLVGDIIVAVDGNDVGLGLSAERLIASYHPGDEITIEILRGGESQQLDVVLGAAPQRADGLGLLGEDPFGLEQIIPELIPQLDGSGVFTLPDLPFAEAGNFLGIVLTESDDGDLQIEYVLPGSPAAQADLRSGDVILSINSERLQSVDDLRRTVRAAGAEGDALALVLRRGDQRLEVLVDTSDHFSLREFLNEFSDDSFAPRDFFNNEFSDSSHGRPYLGVRIESLTPERAEALHIPFEPGVLITNVDADSPAAHVGLHERDVIVGANDHRIANAQQLQQIISRLEPGDVFGFVVLRDGEPHDFEVALGSRALRELDG